MEDGSNPYLCQPYNYGWLLTYLYTVLYAFSILYVLFSTFSQWIAKGQNSIGILALLSFVLFIFCIIYLLYYLSFVHNLYRQYQLELYIHRITFLNFFCYKLRTIPDMAAVIWILAISASDFCSCCCLAFSFSSSLI